jgi:uncharacterized glyoxalase superfamily protein PhnB
LGKNKKGTSMTLPDSIDLKAFVPAKNFEESKRFYKQLGFELNWESAKVAQFQIGPSQFLLQDHYVKDHADNFMMFLLVDDVEEWWKHIQNSGVIERFKITVKPPQDYPWGMREIHLLDPAGVFWHFGQDIDVDA